MIDTRGSLCVFAGVQTRLQRGMHDYGMMSVPQLSSSAMHHEERFNAPDRQVWSVVTWSKS